MTPTPKQRALLMAEGGLSEGVIAGVLGIELADVQRLMVEADPDVELPGGGASLVRTTLTVLTDEQVKALPTTTVEVVPGTPPDKRYLPLWAVVVFRTQDWEYTNLDADATLTIDGFETLGGSHPDAVPVYDFLSGGFDPLVVTMAAQREVHNFDIGGAYRKGVNEVAEVSDLDTFPTLIGISNGSGNLTGGHADNTITVTVAYLLLADI